MLHVYYETLEGYKGALQAGNEAGEACNVMLQAENGMVEVGCEGKEVALRAEEVRQIAKIALVVALLIASMVRVGWCEEDAQQRWNELTGKAVSAYHQGNHQEGINFAKRAYAYAVDHFGQDQSKMWVSNQTLVSMYNLQGRYSDAEPHLKQVVEMIKKMYGNEHPYTLTYMNYLAVLYKKQGRYNKAETLFIQTLQLREKVFGREHPLTITSINNLATIYKDQGRYGKAEPLYKQALQLSEKVLGREHPDTLISINNLATLYNVQGRYSEAESLYKEALRLREKVLGKEHPKTLTSINNLAFFYQHQGRYSEAEPLYKQALQLGEKVFGREHLSTLLFINNLATLYRDQARYSEAKPLYQEVLKVREEMLGKEHPDTLVTINNLATLYKDQGNYNEAELLYKEAIQLSEKVLGRNHPGTLNMQQNYITLLVSSGQADQSMHHLSQLESRLLSRSFQELYASSSEKVRRLYLRSISDFQDEVFSLPSKQAGKKYQQYAAEVMLRWKQVYADESRVQHRLLNFSDDPEAEKLQTQLAAAQAEASIARGQSKEKTNIAELIEKMNQDETALLALAQKLKTGLEIEKVSLQGTLNTLPQDSGLIDYRLFKFVDFKTGKAGERHLAALLLLPNPKNRQRFIFRDLGPFAEIEKHLKDKTAEAYKRLLAPFDDQIKNLKQLYIAPDGPLSLISFASLRLPDGRFLAKTHQTHPN
ncbi:MAG: hypothetical protein D3904_06330, partial [Candidatus Electrothrix sp. EH2]|nr:hypothetical protein [Candidatus Electrothrix sp. EH2]